MIYVGYPCIGKSSVSGRNNFVDLESSLFNDRTDNWAEKYVLVADDLSSQGYDVFVSSHKVVREALKKNNIRFVCVFPALNLEDAWFNRLTSRYKKNPTEKNLRALSRWPLFKQDISDLQKEEHILVLHNCDYDLSYAIKHTPVQDNKALYYVCGPINVPIQSRSGKTVDDIWDESDVLETPNENN